MQVYKQTSVQVMARRDCPAGHLRLPNGNGDALGTRADLTLVMAPNGWGVPLVWDISAAWDEVEIFL